jgi:hypothetical protein
MNIKSWLFGVSTNGESMEGIETSTIEQFTQMVTELSRHGGMGIPGS